jgi:hypothetical protein
MNIKTNFSYQNVQKRQTRPEKENFLLKILNNNIKVKMTNLEINNETPVIDSSTVQKADDASTHPKYITKVLIPQLIKERPPPNKTDDFLKLLCKKRTLDQRYNTMGIEIY